MTECCICPYDRSFFQEWSTQFYHYWYDDVSGEKNCPKNAFFPKFVPAVEKMIVSGACSMDLMLQNGRLIGFIIYQIDREERDGSARIGWGFIREFWIHPELRRRGLGRRLLRHTEERLAELGAKQVYLHTETPAFYRACGYEEESCAEGRSCMVKKI